jgi:diaminopimelate epimerase
MRFTKMQGIGNDYIYVNCFEELVENPRQLAIDMSRYHFGVGADGLVLICPSDTADFEMRIFNADGSEAQMCGNAARCIGKYVFERGMTDKTELTLRSLGGLRQLKLTVEYGIVTRVRVDMGSPELNPRLIPVDLPGEMVLDQRIQAAGRTYQITCVSVGNPHAVVFVDDPDMINLNTIGPAIENHPVFPERINVEFVSILRRDLIKMRVWERGSGETLACGTGACASLVASVLRGQADRMATVKLTGGDLNVEWSAGDNHIYQEGPANYVFSGEWTSNHS